MSSMTRYISACSSKVHCSIKMKEKGHRWQHSFFFPIHLVIPGGGILLRNNDYELGLGTACCYEILRSIYPQKSKISMGFTYNIIMAADMKKWRRGIVKHGCKIASYFSQEEGMKKIGLFMETKLPIYHPKEPSIIIGESCPRSLDLIMVKSSKE